MHTPAAPVLCLCVWNVLLALCLVVLWLCTILSAAGPCMFNGLCLLSAAGHACIMISVCAESLHLQGYSKAQDYFGQLTFLTPNAVGKSAAVLTLSVPQGGAPLLLMVCRLYASISYGRALNASNLL
jgi:hypothetical protein